MPQRVACAAEHLVAGGIERLVNFTQLAAIFIDDAFRANNDDVLLQIVDLNDPLDQAIDVQRRLGNQHNVGLAIRRAEREIAGVPAHYFDDGDATMALGRRANPLHARGRHIDRRGITGSDVVDQLRSVRTVNAPVRGRNESRMRPGSARAATHPVRGGSSGRGRCRSSSVPGPSESIGTDTCMPLSVPSPPTQIRPSMPKRFIRSAISVICRAVVGIDVIPRGADDRAAQRRLELGNRAK